MKTILAAILFLTTLVLTQAQEAVPTPAVTIAPKKITLIEINQIKNAIIAYQLEYSSPPGENVASELMEGNPRKIRFIDWPKNRLSPDGKFLDPWGTPYKFAFNKDGSVLIQSAGPNKTFDSAKDSDDFSATTNPM